MKRIICEVEDDDVVKLVGTLVKLKANFSVEDSGLPHSDKVHRSLQRKTEDGRSTKQVVMDALFKKPKMTKAELSEVLAGVGFAGGTVHSTVSRLKEEGAVTINGDWIQLQE